MNSFPNSQLMQILMYIGLCMLNFGWVINHGSGVLNKILIFFNKKVLIFSTTKLGENLEKKI
jgi:hypothetical protein